MRNQPPIGALVEHLNIRGTVYRIVAQVGPQQVRVTYSHGRKGIMETGRYEGGWTASTDYLSYVYPSYLILPLGT